MSTDRRKRIVIVFLSLCLGVLLLILGCLGTIKRFNKIQESSSQGPVRSIRIIIAKSQREELFDQFRKFAEKHGFEVQLTDFNTNGENFQFSMLRDDITLIAGDVPPDQALVKVRIYRKYPAYPVDEEVFDDLVNDLKSFLSEIPNITITEE